MEFTRIIIKSQDASCGMHKLHKFEDQSCELQRLSSSTVEELHLGSHSGLNNGLTKVNPTVIKLFNFQIWFLTV